MNGQPVGVLRVSSTLPKQKRMTIYMANPRAPFMKIVKNIARGTLIDAFWTSSAVNRG